MRTLAAAAGAVVLAAGGLLAGSQLAGTETITVAAPTQGCNDWPVTLSQGECFAAGTLRYVALTNLQGASQFCVWRRANPGEWKRLKASAVAGDQASVITWFGGAIRNVLEAYQATGAPPFTIGPNTAPNVCKTPLPAPVVAGVTPGETDATVTIAP